MAIHSGHICENAVGLIILKQELQEQQHFKTQKKRIKHKEQYDSLLLSASNSISGLKFTKNLKKRSSCCISYK